MVSQSRYQPSDAQLTLLADVIHQVTARAISPDHRRDFSQTVHVRLLESNYRIFRHFRGQSSLRTYLTVVVTRLLKDWQNHTRGKWRPSAAAIRLGSSAIRLDRLIHRDGLLVHEAVEMVWHAGSPYSRQELTALAEQLPVRTPRRVVSVDYLQDAPDPRNEDPLLEHERASAVRRRTQALHRAMRSLPEEDRRLLAARFANHGQLSAMARDTGADVKRLYRRCDRVLQQLRASLCDANGAERSHFDHCTAG